MPALSDASRYHGVKPEEADWSAPERPTRAVAEFLGALDEDKPDADRKSPKAVSLSDPCSAWTAKANKRVQFGYGLNYLIDIEYAVMVDVEATPARTYDEVVAAKKMIDRTEERDLPESSAPSTAMRRGQTFQRKCPLDAFKQFLGPREWLLHFTASKV